MNNKFELCAFADEAADSLGGQIAALKRNNIPYLELRGVDGKNVADITISEAEDIAKELAAAGIKVWAIGSPIGKVDITSPFENELKRLEHIIALCKIFSCVNVRMFSFFTNEFDKYRDEVIFRLNKMCEIANENGVNLVHENERGIYGDTAARVLDLLSNVPKLNFVFDPANFIQAGEDINEAINSLLHKAAYVHIKDSLKETHQIVPAGEGSGEIVEIIKRLRKTGKEYVLTLEPHLKAFTSLKQIDSHELKNIYEFNSQDESFDFAAKALKKCLAI